MRYNRNQSVQRISLMALLLAMALVLGFFENLLPIAPGIPGIKLGLSNVVLLFALYAFGPASAFLLMGLKVVLSGLLFSGVSAMMYSLAGGVLSMAAMTLLKKTGQFSIVTVSMVGGAMHNVGQVAIAILVMTTSQLGYLMGILLLVGLGTGLLTGIIAKLALEKLKYIQ